MSGEEAEAKVVVWTTWEELLLACAVKRHGLNDWDSVAMELQSRSSPTTTLLSPQICEHKFHDLKRRFTTSHDITAADEDQGRDDVTLPWLEDLRRLRVAELKQEVHRYDLSIQSLQSKVKRLEEDRERSLKENNENDDVKTDLAKDKSTANSIKHEEDERSEINKREGSEEPLGDAAGKLDENRSSNESNSTDNRGTGSKAEPKPVDDKPETVEEAKPVTVGGEDSCNDSSDRGKVSQERKVDSAELRDSVDESKEMTTTKESSDVQSSASLTRKKGRKGVEEGEGGTGSGGGGKGDAAATTATRSVVNSEPFVGFLDIMRSHKHGSVFERRLDSQKAEKYKNMVRQHVDLHTIQTRIEDGSYTCCSNKFYLDLLLLFNNAIVFFPKSSHEALAAHNLRDLVMKEIKKNRNPSSSSSNPQPPPESLLTKVQQPKLDSDISDSLLAKNNKSSVPLVVCRKRSSVAAKASSSSGNNKVEKQAAHDNNKPLLSSKPPIKSSSTTQNEDDSPIKLKLKEKPVTGVRSMRRSTKGRPNNNTTTTSNTNNSNNQNTSSSSQQPQPHPVSAQKGDDLKLDKKKPELDNAAAKKRGAADFLKRIKKNSPAKASSVEASIGSPDDSKGSKNDHHQKKKVGERKDMGPLRRSGNGSGKQVKEDSSPSKRSVGRPPKKGKEAQVGVGKRGREGGEGEGTSKRPNKRSRR